MGRISADQIDDYQRDGFTVVRDVLTAEQLTGLQELTQDYIEQSRSITRSNELYDLDEGHSPDEPRLTRIKTPHRQHPMFRSVLQSAEVLDCIRPLIGDSIRVNNSKLNTKAARGGAAVQWHQDWSFYPHTNDDLLAIGILLSDVTERDGPLLVVPGSHRRAVLPHYSSGVFCGAIDPAHPDAHLDTAVALTGKAGDMTIHHVRALHGSAPNLGENPRLLLLYECVAADAWPINGTQNSYTGLNQQEFWATMQQSLICGEQTLSPRLADVPVLMPLPPPEDATSIFKVQQSGGAVDAFADAS
ncbi:MAG: phytanoyl-CoA dioxygenase family protein [Gammaproteobacteria bacterium]|nr:phytanoyl-CoA dioxygenase family protein [Gammaproteobacteria bacterium]